MNGNEWLNELTPAEREYWELAESASDPNAVSSLISEAGQQKAQLFKVLALQMRGAKADEVFETLENMERPKEPSLLIWWKAEDSLAALQEKVRDIEHESKLTDSELVRLTTPSSPPGINTLIAGRGYLALGLDALQNNQRASAEVSFEASLECMRQLRSDAGIATVLTELGKLHAWSSDAETATRYFMESLSIWQGIDPNKAFATWHEIGALLLDTGQWESAVSILSRNDSMRPSPRTKNALTRAQIGAEDYAGAFLTASAALEQERFVGRENLPLSGYRAAMIFRDLGEIACRSNGEAIIGLESADDYLDSAISALEKSDSKSRPVFTHWLHRLERMEHQDDASGNPAPEIDFGHFRLMQLETLIFKSMDPEGAAINFDKLADIYANRGEAFHEIECRRDAADSFRRAGMLNLAVRQASIAVRVTTENNLDNLGYRCRQLLSDLLKEALDPVFVVSGYLFDVNLSRSAESHFTFSARSISTGKPVVIHRIMQDQEALRDTGEKLFEKLGSLNDAGRVHPGLTSLLEVSTASECAPYLTFVMEQVEGLSLNRRRDEFYGRPQLSIRLARDLCLALRRLHQFELFGPRINADTVVLEHGDYPVIVGWPVQVSTQREQYVQQDLQQIAMLLVDLLTEGKGLPSRGALIRFFTFPIRGLKWDPLLFAKRDRALNGLGRVLTDVLARSEQSDIRTAQQFADALEQFTT